MKSTCLQLLVMISLASAAISFTITTTTIFEWLRELISPIHKKIEELIHCPWCLGHYIVLVMLIIFNKQTLFLNVPEFWHYLLNWFACVCLMGIWHYILLRTYKPIAEAMARREILKLHKNKE